MQKSVLFGLAMSASVFGGAILQARIVDNLATSSASGVSSGPEAVSAASLVVASGAAAVAPAAIVESMDNPASYFASFDPITTFASCTLIRDVVIAKKDMDARLLKKLKAVLDAQDPSGAGRA